MTLGFFPIARRFRVGLLRILCLAFVTTACALAVSAQEDDNSWYEIDRLNNGLPGVSEFVDRSTPRAATESFLDLTERKEFGQAAHLLNLDQVAVEDRARRGPILAEHLASVLRRRAWIDWSGLSGRPDAMLEAGTSNDAMAGKPRRDLGLEVLEIDGHVYEIRLGRYKPARSDPVWLFTPQTVDGVPAIYRAFGPRWFESFIPDSLKSEVGGLRLWEWGALPVLIALVCLVGWVTSRVIHRAAGIARRNFLQRACRNAALPLALVAAAAAAQSLLGLVVSFSGPVTTIITPILIILMVAGVGLAALRVMDAIIEHISRRFVGEIDDARSSHERELYTSIYALRRIVLLAMVGFAIVFVLSQLHLFETLGLTLLASAGVLTVLLGIAGQAVFGNILASLQIAIAKPVRIGDSIEYEGRWCYVESIFFTFIQLRSWDERRIIVPVKYFVSQPFENWSVQDARVLRGISVQLDHMADIGVLRSRFADLVRADPDIEDAGSAETNVTAQSEESLTVGFYVMAPDPSSSWTIEYRLREQILAFIRDTHPEWWPRRRYVMPEQSRAPPDG